MTKGEGDVPKYNISSCQIPCNGNNLLLINHKFLGADQVALNGDTANKIGTYMLSVLAKYHGVSFYPVVPITSINRNRESGDDIPIEERPSKELLAINGVFIGPEDTPVWNPAFDITPGELITKIITDIDLHILLKH
uniref:Methylthioribose-1-phosphate isomerase n=1 Tax=Heterorhabditis bacteriophora TaxID=37862 RepID=A0A1I7WZB5_HETBA